VLLSVCCSHWSFFASFVFHSHWLIFIPLMHVAHSEHSRWCNTLGGVTLSVVLLIRCCRDGGIVRSISADFVQNHKFDITPSFFSNLKTFFLKSYPTQTPGTSSDWFYGYLDCFTVFFLISVFFLVAVVISFFQFFYLRHHLSQNRVFLDFLCFTFFSSIWNIFSFFSLIKLAACLSFFRCNSYRIV